MTSCLSERACRLLYAHLGQVALEGLQCAPCRTSVTDGRGKVQYLLPRAFGRRQRFHRCFRKRTADLLNRYPDRFLFGSDTVAPSSPEKYYAVFDMYAPLWSQLTPEASEKVRTGNYLRLFDEGRRRVRAWEKAHVK